MINYNSLIDFIFSFIIRYDILYENESNYENNNKFTITSPSLDCLGCSIIDTTHFKSIIFLGVSNGNLFLASH